ncbi:uncharacterized protein [Amphiura filiformis]|uniref:uncharacterized protein n=1 Tax=Amphiura filiformis TaxID=82378 RepID=UPI003B21CE1D
MLAKGDIHEAAFAGHLQAIEQHLNLGEDPNTATMHGLTPLHKAAMNGNLQCAQLLVRHGAQVNIADVAGFTPLHFAASNGYLDVVKWLVEDCNASPMLPSNKGRTPRVVAKKRGHNKVALYMSQVESKLEGQMWFGTA